MSHQLEGSPPAERKLPGYAATSHYPTSPWEAFEPEANWEESSLWVRLCFGGRYAQLKGTLESELPGESLIGILEPDFRPAQSQAFVVGTRRRAPANLLILADGSVLLLEVSITQSFVLHVVFELPT